jgi:uncharacterized membrane protein
MEQGSEAAGPGAGADSQRPTTAYAIVGLAMLAFAVLHTRILIWKSTGLMVEWPIDLTFFHNLVWNVTQGNGHIQSGSYHEPAGLFGETHFEPILLLAVPFYWLAPRIETLFAVQSTLLALGAIGVYRLARVESASPLAAAVGSLIYLGWWPLWRMAMADIRPLTWSIPFLLLLVAALRETRKWEAFTWALLACLCREEIILLVMSAALASMAWKAAPQEQRRQLAKGIIGASAMFLVVTSAFRLNITFYIQPGEWIRDFLGGRMDETGASAWGRTPASMFWDRIRYFMEWLVPVGFGALLAPELLLAAAPLVVYLFSQAQWEALWDGPYIHHPAPAVALAAAAGAVGWTRLLSRWKLPLAAVTAILVALLVWEGLNIKSHWEPHILPEIAPWLIQDEARFESLDVDNREWLRDRVRGAERLRALVPKDAAIVTDYQTLHLFSGRFAVYCYQQMEIQNVEPPEGGLTEPLLPYSPQLTETQVAEHADIHYAVPNPPRRQPRWALVHNDHQPWHRRVQAAGLRRIDAASDWVLYGPPEALPPGAGGAN